MLSSATFKIEIKDKHKVAKTQCKVLQTLLVFKFLKGLAGLKGGSFFLFSKRKFLEGERRVKLQWW